MSVFDVSIHALEGEGNPLGQLAGKTTLVVNVASKCGLTPQYTALQQLQDRFAAQGFSVLGVPCNQFMGQEPGTATEIAEFCSTQYHVSFPITEKVDVNGAKRHPLFQQLTTAPDAEGHTGDVRWNFEKFLVNPSGEVVARFSPQTAPDDPAVVAAIEASLNG